MISDNNLMNLIIAMVVFIPGSVMAFLFLFRPYSLVRRQAAFYYTMYKKQSSMSDEEIDRLIKPFWFLFTIDSMSHLVNRGQDHPEEFRRLMIVYRLVGGLLFIVLFVAITILILGGLTGSLIVAE